MVQEQAFHELLRELQSNERSAIAVGESEIVLKIFDSKTKLSLQSPVYDGEGVIPDSVREAVSHPLPGHSSIHTALKVDEGGGRIFLHYLGALNHLSRGGFRDLLDSFAVEADQWRHYLDENDGREKIHIKRK